MTRKAIITRHDGTQFTLNFSSTASDETMLRHISGMPNLHLICTIDLCTVDAVFNNTPPIASWAKITDRLTS